MSHWLSARARNSDQRIDVSLHKNFIALLQCLICLDQLPPSLTQGLFSHYLSKLSTCVHHLRRLSDLDGSGRGQEWTLLSHAFRLIQCIGMYGHH